MELSEVLMQRALVMFDNSIAQGTRRTYGTGGRTWLAFAEKAELSQLLSSTPKWYAPNEQLSYELWCVLMFVIHCATVLKLAPSTVSNYVAGVRFHLTRFNVDTKFVDESVFLAKVRAGMWNMYRAVHKEADTKVLALSTDIVVKGVRILFGSEAAKHQAIAAALAVMRSCLLRASETVPCRGTSHYLKTEDVELMIGSDCGMMFVDAGGVSEISLAMVKGVTITVSSAKNDRHGRGNKVSFSRVGSELSAFNITLMLFRWAKRKGLRRGDPFFSFRSQWYLSYKEFQASRAALRERVLWQ